MKTDGFPSAIPTFYSGTQFKSRLEAQCAVLFDKIGWKWEYEKFSLMLPGGISFIPDFYIPETGLLVECRGYSTDHGNRQLECLSGLIQKARYGPVRVPELALPGGNEIYEFFIIGPGSDLSVCNRNREPLTYAVFVYCQCGGWNLLGGPFCYECLKKARYESSFALTIRDGKLLINGVLLEEASI